MREFGDLLKTKLGKNRKKNTPSPPKNSLATFRQTGHEGIILSRIQTDWDPVKGSRISQDGRIEVVHKVERRWKIIVSWNCTFQLDYVWDINLTLTFKWHSDLLLFPSRAAAVLFQFKGCGYLLFRLLINLSWLCILWNVRSETEMWRNANHNFKKGR